MAHASRTLRLRSAPIAFGIWLSACGDPQGGQPKPTQPVASCTQFGQRCEFAPGKLGTCVQRDDCSGAPSECLVCQSQH